MPRYEIVLAVIGILIIGYLVMNQYGCPLVSHSETTEWTDGSSHDQLKPSNNDNNKEIDTQTEAVVQELAEIFAEDPAGNNRGRTANATRYLSKDERAYYQEIRKEYAFDEQLEKAKDWYNILSTASQTYQTMESIFNKNKPDEAPNDFYDELEERFHIPKTASQVFAEKGKRALKDWALFVEENKK